ncbi:unnamed protein product [Rhodiola kirilowii]
MAYARIYHLLLVLSLLPAQFSSLADECCLVVGKHASLHLQLVQNSPGVKSGRSVVCGRVQICGLSRLKNITKYSHAVRVRVSVTNTTARAPNVEFCLHRNVSLGLGMCHQEKWKKLAEESWVGYISPFDRRILDLRMPSSLVGNVEVSIVEEFMSYRVIFLVMGLVLMASASYMSESILFYYSSAMTVGVLLVVLMVLFQGMKLLPTGRKNSLAIFVYSIMVGLGSFLLSYLSNLPRIVLTEIGISEDMYGPLTIFAITVLVIAGAWLGFWVVRKLVLTSEGTIDVSTSHFVTWAIRILATSMILQSSLDLLLAGGALFLGTSFLTIVRRVFKTKYLRDRGRHLMGLSMGNDRKVRDASKYEDTPEKFIYTSQSIKKSSHQGYETKEFTRSPRISPFIGTGSTPSESDTFISSFHSTPERKKYSKEEWNQLTRYSTKKALEELVSSPDFSKWAVANAERITLTPNTADISNHKRRWWFPWP